MTLTKTRQDVLNDALPGTLEALLSRIRFGDIIRSITTTLRKKTPVADAAQLATVAQVGLSDIGRAASIIRAYARSGTGTAGELAVAAVNATPTTGQIAIAPNGDIVTLLADAYVDVDVTLVVSKGDVVTLSLPVVTNVLTIPTQYTTLGIVYLIDANATVGTVTGRKIVLAPAASAPATTQAKLNLAKTTVTFATADAVTQATVKLSIAPTLDLDSTLSGMSQGYL